MPAKTTAKVFDVAKPARQVPADANSRPVIVTNRPIMQDPMMTPQEAVTETADKPSPAATKVVIKPLTETEKQADEKPAESSAASEADQDQGDEVTVKKSDNPLAGLPVITLDDLPIVKSPEKSKPTTKDQEVPVEAAEPKVEEAVAETKATVGTPEDEKPSARKPLAKSKLEIPPTPEPAKEAPVSAGPAAQPPIDDIAASVEGPKGDKAALELEAQAKQQIVLDELVENKTYFLPLNSVEKRRDKVVAGLGVVLIIGLGFLLLDLLMDVGAVHISGIEPPIKFFSD